MAQTGLQGPTLNHQSTMATTGDLHSEPLTPLSVKAKVNFPDEVSENKPTKEIADNE